MEKGSTMLVAMVISTMLVAMTIGIMLMCVIASASANTEDLIIGRSMEIEGVGIINSNLDVSTEPHFTGLELVEELFTISGGYNGISGMKYLSSFELEMLNATGNVSTGLEYSSTAEIENCKRTVYLKNTNVGAIMGVRSYGDSSSEISLYSDDSIVSAETSGNIIGKLKLFNKVIDTSDKRTIITRDITGLEGLYNYSWSAWAERNLYPADEENGDWLGCP